MYVCMHIVQAYYLVTFSLPLPWWVARAQIRGALAAAHDNIVINTLRIFAPLAP